jgi:hypothetical protein
MNPYRAAPGSEPPLLAGRDEELIQSGHAIELTAGGGAARPIVHVGLRGMGKTALLRATEARVRAAEGIVISAEASANASLAPTLRLALESARKTVSPLSSRLRNAVDAALKTLPEASFELPEHLGSVSLKATKVAKTQEQLIAALEKLNTEVRKNGRWLCISIDEIQHADIPTLYGLVSLVHQTAGTDEPVLFLGAGLRNSMKHLHDVATYTERWRYTEIGFLSLAETMMAIQEPAVAAGASFERDALQALATATRGYPFFIQEFASTAWARHAPSKKSITLSEVEETLSAVRTEMERKFYGEPLARLTPRELRYVLALASLGEGPKLSAEVAAVLDSVTREVSSARQQLIRKDVVFSPDLGLVEFRIPLMATYINEHKRVVEAILKKRRDLQTRSLHARRRATLGYVRSPQET